MIEEVERMIIHSEDFQNKDFYSKWYDDINELIIAEDVWEIPARALRHFYGTKKVKILGNMKYLDSTMFDGFYELEEICLPKSLEIIASSVASHVKKVYAPKDSYADIWGRYLTSERPLKTVDESIIQKMFAISKGKRLIQNVPAKAHVEIDGITLETALLYTDDKDMQVKGIINGEEIDIIDPIFLQRLKEVIAYEYFDVEVFIDGLKKPFDALPYIYKGLNFIFTLSCESNLTPKEILNDTVMQHRMFNLIAVAWSWGYDDDAWSEKAKVKAYLSKLRKNFDNLKNFDHRKVGNRNE